MTSTLTSGTCPSCNGKEIYTTRDVQKRGDRGQIAVTGFARIFLDTYICLGCGHFEEIVPTSDLAAVSDKIRSSWNKV